MVCRSVDSVFLLRPIKTLISRTTKTFSVGILTFRCFVRFLFVIRSDSYIHFFTGIRWSCSRTPKCSVRRRFDGKNHLKSNTCLQNDEKICRRLATHRKRSPNWWMVRSWIHAEGKSISRKKNLKKQKCFCLFYLAFEITVYIHFIALLFHF